MIAVGEQPLQLADPLLHARSELWFAPDAPLGMWPPGSAYSPEDIKFNRGWHSRFVTELRYFVC